MEGNKEEAARALNIAKTHRDAGKLSSAIKFARKSESLYSTPEAIALIRIIERDISAAPSTSSTSEVHESTTNGDAKTSGAEAHPSASGMHHRHGNAGGNTTASGPEPAKKREYTPEQMKVVKRVKACKVTAYYEILSVEKTCDDGQVRKAYRKLALALHPDKNGAPGADEAFKMVSKAFTVLSDPDKRAVYDMNPGFDPESRGGGGGGGGGGGPSPFSNMSRGFPRGGRGGMEQDITPEDLFNMFFGGGGMGNGGFGGGGPMFATSFGNGGSFHTFGGGQGARARARAGGRQAGNQTAEKPPTWVQLLPVLLLMGFAILTFIPTLFGFGPTPDPEFSFSPRAPYTSMRNTAGLDVPYYVNQAAWEKHPIHESIPEAKRSDPKAGRFSNDLRKFEQTVEQRYVTHLRDACEHEQHRKQQRIEANRGFFGIGADWDNIRSIEQEPLPNCQKLRTLGANRRY